MLLATATGLLQVGTPTALEVFRRSRRAYDSASTFEEDVTGGVAGKLGTAHISFARPGRLRVTGDTTFGTKYDLLSVGKSTSLYNRGKWSQIQGVDLGIAAITGISGNAGTLVPATLMHTAWGELGAGATGGYTVATATAGGRKLFRLHGTTPFDLTVWIDAASYLVVKTVLKTKGATVVVDFSPPVVDGAIPDSRFSRFRGVGTT